MAQAGIGGGFFVICIVGYSSLGKSANNMLMAWLSETAATADPSSLAAELFSIAVGFGPCMAVKAYRAYSLNRFVGEE